jgi:serine/threonine protein kinase
VKRTEIAVRGAPSTGALRLELSGGPGEEGLVLELLHDDRQTGTLARVLGGWVGLGEVSVPVAVKLQRDTALSQEDRGSVAAKFDKERNVHRRLQDCAGAAGPERVVRQLEVWKGPADREADSLEPCILCARARHGLAPRCPECNDPAALLEEVQLTEDCGLRCNRCNRQFWSTPKTRAAILDATLRRDAACHGCALEHSPDPDACRGSAVFLNFFRNRVLLLERLDLDLDDYLRWAHNGGSKASRPVARRAFEEHRRLLRERRERLPGPAVQKIYDLRLVADLFADVLAGVEYLHRHEVAHLDLKLANICVRFRGADLEVKIIDLGLSDDPETLAYLRQAEGPLSLWTDYSAPEFRRPRSHPLAVDGRFRGDACELDWPRAERHTPETPCPGDVLFFEDHDLARQPWRLTGVRPGGADRLLVQAVAEPRHRTWLGEPRPVLRLGPEARHREGLAVVREKHCGFPADTYSLGMLLLAILVGRPDVGDFRDALPSVQIELEDASHEGTPLPNRALVQRLLNKPSKHLQVFHSYAHRLAAYGVAQPLAEELLGMVLRATLRGHAGISYLADRGADARPALRRLRADLDAVRGAIANTLAVAQAAAVREARLAVLDRLRSRLQGRAVHIGPATRLDPGSRLLFPALDLGAAGDAHCASELSYLVPLAGEPGSVLDRWEQELTGPAEQSPAAARTWEFVQHYCRVAEPDVSVAARFLEAYHELAGKLRQGRTPADHAQAEDQERVRRWLDDHEALRERLECGSRFVELFWEFVQSLKDNLLRPWDRRLRERRFLFFRRRAIRLPLSRDERSAIRNDELRAALKQLSAAVHEGVVARGRNATGFEAALARWRAWFGGRSWLDALARLEAEALRQRQNLEAGYRAWDQAWSRSVNRLSQWLTEVDTLLEKYQPLLSVDAVPEEVSVRLTRAQRELLDLSGAEEAVVWLQRNWPPPGETVEAVFALWGLGSDGGSSPAGQGPA